MDRLRASRLDAAQPGGSAALLRWNVEVMAYAQLGAPMVPAVPSHDPPALADELAAMRRRAALRPIR